MYDYDVIWKILEILYVYSLGIINSSREMLINTTYLASTYSNDAAAKSILLSVVTDMSGAT